MKCLLHFEDKSNKKAKTPQKYEKIFVKNKTIIDVLARTSSEDKNIGLICRTR